jgi:hypothetical protein
MTVAVCLKCGAIKHGAFTECRKCGHHPDDEEDLTKHLLVTDHFHDRKTLDAIAARIKAGLPIEFDPESLKSAWVNKAEMAEWDKEIGRGCGKFVAIVLAVIGAVIGLVVWLRR